MRTSKVEYLLASDGIPSFVRFDTKLFSGPLKKPVMIRHITPKVSWNLLKLPLDPLNLRVMRAEHADD
jgi:hypothetical protein